MKNSNKLITIIAASILFGITNIASAEPNNSAIEIFKPALNKVSYELSAEEWAKTSTVMVNVGVDAIVNEDKLEQVRVDILKKLNQLAPNAQWHITSFVRNQDQSGLERLQMQAQARVSNNALGNLRQQAKSLSKPGETMTVLNIDYSPSLAEIETTRMELHKQIYNQAKAELAELNQMYPNQKYYIHNIEFLSQPQLPEPQPAMRMVLMASNAKSEAAPMPVSDKVMVTARVTLASTIATTN